MLERVGSSRDSFRFPYAVFCIRAHLYVGVAHIIPLRCRCVSAVLCGQHQVSLGWSRDCLCSATIVAKQRFTRTLATFRTYVRTDCGGVIFLNCYQ